VAFSSLGILDPPLFVSKSYEYGFNDNLLLLLHLAIRQQVAEQNIDEP